MKGLRLLLLLSVLIPGIAQAVSVGAVEVEGLQRIDISLISDQVRSFAESTSAPAGRRLAARQLLQTLYETGFFADVRIDERAGLFVVHLQERPLVRDVRIEGAESIDEEKRQGALKVHAGSFYDPAELVSTRDALTALYREEGIQEVHIDAVTETALNGSVDIVFRVKESDKVYIRSVAFMGNRFFSDAALREKLQVGPRHVLSWLSGGGVYDPALIQMDGRRIAARYQQAGFLKVEVRKPVVTWSEDRHWVDLIYQVEEGLRYRLRELSFTGDIIFSDSLMRDQLGLSPGQPADRMAIEEAVQSWTDLYSDLGFAFARVNPDFTFDDSRREVDLTVHVQRGQPVYLRLIEVRGNTKTRDKVIRREILIEEGELFSGSRLRESRQRVFALGYFEDVSLTTRAYGVDRMDLVVQVREKATGTASAGLGYSSIDQFVGNLRLNFGNLLGYGIRVDLNAEFGGRKQSFTFRYTDPYFLDTKASFGVDLFYSKQTYFLSGSSDQTYDQMRVGGELTLGYLIGLYTRAYTGYRHEYVNLEGTSFVSSLFAQGGRTASVQFTLKRDSKSHPYDPLSGSVNLAKMELAGKYFGGDYTFQKYTGLTQWFFNPFWQFVIMLRGEIGLAASTRSERIPFSERYFLGGIYSIRGYDYRSVGPQRTYLVDPNNPWGASQQLVIGGNKQLLANIELTFPLLPQAGIKGVLFFDAGNAWLEEEPYLATAPKFGTGWGFRWFSPMGPLRFEWGYPLFPEKEQRTSVFEFTIGTYF